MLIKQCVPVSLKKFIEIDSRLEILRILPAGDKFMIAGHPILLGLGDLFSWDFHLMLR